MKQNVAVPFPKHVNFPPCSLEKKKKKTLILQIAQVHQTHSAKLEQQVTVEMNLNTI